MTTPQGLISRSLLGCLRAKTPLDRLLRDAITMSEHLLLADSFLEIIGGTMVGDASPISWL